jgi:hypothetical protein
MIILLVTEDNIIDIGEDDETSLENTWFLTAIVKKNVER